MAWISLFALLSFALPACAGEPASEVKTFLSGAFNEVPKAQHIWLTGELRANMRDILRHDYPLARVSYWRSSDRTAWVLDEIGKERPITVGIVIDHNRVEKVRVLIYRESRGWEVKSPAFTAQFSGARLGADRQLDRAIDGISGATLSVRALQKLTRIALLLHRQTMTGEHP
ncbi:MAG: FMN-binding protein [Gammaproteobacteria bacterium]|nr:FMN-binding protein [Gammaproteobacteria bacterium]MBU1625067.1 FMN-binding protein [Gammaproteobacteria bacterium]MBU1981327.1 FMN-binding protein [Gammaproteobacteria bacterium]